MDVGSTELKILQVTQPYVDLLGQGYSQIAITSISRACVYFEGVPLMTFLSYFYFVVFFRIFALSVCRHVWLINITIFNVEALS